MEVGLFSELINPLNYILSKLAKYLKVVFEWVAFLYVLCFFSFFIHCSR